MFTAEERADIAGFSVGIAIDRWAPACWRILNVMAFSPNASVERFAKFVGAVIPILPCHQCREHFQSYVATTPPPHTTSEATQRWLVEFHNIVSDRAGSPKMSFDAVREDTLAALDGDALGPGHDLWAFVLAVATLFKPAQRVLVQTLVDEIRGFPVTLVADAVAKWYPFALDTASALFQSALRARNEWATGWAEKWTLFEAVESFASPNLYEHLGITDAAERTRMGTLFHARMLGANEARRAAYDRINGTSSQLSLSDYMAPHVYEKEEPTSPQRTPKWTATQVALFVIFIVVAVIICILIIYLTTRRDSGKQ